MNRYSKIGLDCNGDAGGQSQLASIANKCGHMCVSALDFQLEGSWYANQSGKAKLRLGSCQRLWEQLKQQMRFTKESQEGNK